MNITIYCSASDVGESYTKAAREFATSIAQDGHTLIWGGSNKGTMKVIADAARAAGGKIVGISVELLKDAARKDADEMFIAKDWPERKANLLGRADVLVVLPGGLGTLDEVADVLEQKKHNRHNKPVVFLNTGGFYDGLKVQLQRMDAEGFLPRKLEEFLYFADTPEDALIHINKYAESGELK